MAAGQQSHESNQVKLMGLKEEKDTYWAKIESIQTI